MMLEYDAVEIGYQLPELVSEPISRWQMALYQGGSGDHNPIHTDSDFAKSSGLDDVIVFGMFVKAHVGRMLSDWAGPEAVKEIESRFTAMTFINDVLTCAGTVVGKEEVDGEKLLKTDITVTRQDGEVLIKGSALVRAS